jgi:cell division septal protein FtsQ
MSHTRIISNFIEFQASHNGEAKGKKELEEREKIAKELESTQRRDKIQRRFLFIMATIAAGGLCLTAYFGFINSKRSDKAVKNTEITNEKLDIMDNSGLSRAYQEIKQEKGVLKLDSIKKTK